jgi:hypothetical protein
MRLSYRILWFDNSPELLDSLTGDIEYLKSVIAQWGFIPEVIAVHTPDDFFKFSPFDGIDLVVVDFDLEEFGSGQDFIAQVRDKQVFTEVIFYSAQAADALWEAVKDRQLEGIYVAHKETIISRILGVSEHSVRKILDVENMRGIVMAEVGDLDRLLGDIFTAAVVDLSEEQRHDVYARFHEAAHKQAGEHQAALEAFLAGPSPEALLQLCDSNKRWSNYNRLKRHHVTLQARKLGDYPADILRPRNFLAHGVPAIAADGSLEFSYSGKTYSFTREEGNSLRVKIIAYKRALQEILDTLTKTEKG